MPARLLRFGLFELNTGSRQLLKQGRRVRLQEQPLRVLEVLLEEPGRLVTREELRRRLWPSDVHVDFELGLTGAIKRLRLALGDTADNPRFIETIPKSGYRFIAPVQEVTDHVQPHSTNLVVIPATHGSAALAAQPAPVLSPQLQPRPVPAARPFPWLALGLIAAVALAIYLLPMATAPRLTRVVKLSNSGRAWPGESLFSDGARVYYTEFAIGTGLRLRQILLNGNEDTVVGGLPADSLVRGLSPDHTTFLVTSRKEVETGRPSPLWIVPVVGGPARRLGDLLTNDFAWAPDGNSLAFARDTQLCIAKADASDARVIATVPGHIFYPRWSPDGRRLRFSVLGPKREVGIWEVEADGRHLHPLQFNWPGAPMESFGDWTADGRYFVFVSRREGISNLWALEESSDWLHRRRSQPVQLTAGPLSYFRPLPSRDGRQIFALATQPDGELVRYDQNRKEFVPYLSGRSAEHLDFTRDGQWVTYIVYPEGTLWRARIDGSEELQLTFTPLRASNPRWSPDGKRIVFAGRMPGALPKLFSISPEGGNPTPLLSEPHAETDPTWSPDGQVLVYGRDPEGENQDVALFRLDLRGGRSEKIRGTDGLYAPRWSPDGRFLTARSAQGDRPFFLVDPATGQRTLLSTRQVEYPVWSADSHYVYFRSPTGDESAFFRLHVPDGKEEKIGDIPFKTAGSYGDWSGQAPDGSLLTLRDRGQTDVYVLSVSLK